MDLLNNPFCNDLSQNLSFGHLNMVTGQIGPKQNWPQVKTAPGQIVLSQIGPSHIGPGSNSIIYIIKMNYRYLILIINHFHKGI
jgi:hypothetical protein